MSLDKNDIISILIDLTNNQTLKIIPIAQIYSKIMEKEKNIRTFHELLVKMEEEHEIYLEPINDPSRLSQEEQKLIIRDTVRGSLYYVGFWEY